MDLPRNRVFLCLLQACLKTIGPNSGFRVAFGANFSLLEPIWGAPNRGFWMASGAGKLLESEPFGTDLGFFSHSDLQG